MGFKRKKKGGAQQQQAAQASGADGNVSPTSEPKRFKKAEYFDGKSEQPRVNEKFEAYYKAQGIVPEEEWDAFMASLRAPLPSSFRICAGTGYAVRGQRFFHHMIPQMFFL